MTSHSSPKYFCQGLLTPTCICSSCSWSFEIVPHFNFMALRTNWTSCNPPSVIVLSQKICTKDFPLKVNVVGPGFVNNWSSTLFHHYMSLAKKLIMINWSFTVKLISNIWRKYSASGHFVCWWWWKKQNWECQALWEWRCDCDSDFT